MGNLRDCGWSHTLDTLAGGRLVCPSTCGPEGCVGEMRGDGAGEGAGEGGGEGG